MPDSLPTVGVVYHTLATPPRSVIAVTVTLSFVDNTRPVPPQSTTVTPEPLPDTVTGYVATTPQLSAPYTPADSTTATDDDDDDAYTPAPTTSTAYRSVAHGLDTTVPQLGESIPRTLPLLSAGDTNTTLAASL